MPPPPLPGLGFTPSQGTLGGCKGVASVRRGHRRARSGSWALGGSRGRCGSLRAEFGDGGSRTGCRGRPGQRDPPVGVHGAAGVSSEGGPRGGGRWRVGAAGGRPYPLRLLPPHQAVPSGGPSRGPRGATPLFPGPRGQCCPFAVTPAVRVEAAQPRILSTGVALGPLPPRLLPAHPSCTRPARQGLPPAPSPLTHSQ